MARVVRIRGKKMLSLWSSLQITADKMIANMARNYLPETIYIVLVDNISYDLFYIMLSIMSICLLILYAFVPLIQSQSQYENNSFLWTFPNI